MFELKFTTTNDAFNDGSDGRDEAARLLREVAERLEAGHMGGPVHDTNGNRVGSWEMTQ